MLLLFVNNCICPAVLFPAYILTCPDDTPVFIPYNTILLPDVFNKELLPASAINPL